MSSILCSECGELMTIEGETLYEHWLHNHALKIIREEEMCQVHELEA